jgi:catechol 2,3-dioxygenase-like lactoylglutathione lyase family enzyme
MIDHTGIGVVDMSRSAAFYDAALGALGLRRVMQLPVDSGADGVDMVSTIQCSGSIASTRLGSDTTRRSWARIVARSTHSTPPL